MARFPGPFAAPLLALVPALVLALAGGAASAQSQAAQLGDFELNLRATQDVVSGETFEADAAYLERAGKPGWPPFAVVVPTAARGDYESRVVETPATGLVKFVFATPGGGFIEAVSFSAAKMPMAESDRRLEYFATVLSQDVVPGLTEGKAEASRANIRRVRVGGVEAVELFGTYTSESYGRIHWRLLGLPHPEREEGLVALAQISEEAVPIASPNDFSASLSGRVLDSLSFR